MLQILYARVTRPFLFMRRGGHARLIVSIDVHSFSKRVYNFSIMVLLIYSEVFIWAVEMAAMPLPSICTRLMIFVGIWEFTPLRRF